MSGTVGALALLLAMGAPAEREAQRFREAGEAARAGDHIKAIAVYHDLATTGHESASLYWNWAQSAGARSATGETLWALLRAREIEPGDRAVSREIERLRESANLDAAEIAPDPLAAVARFSRRVHLDLVGLGILAASVIAHALARRPRPARAAQPLAVVAVIIGLTCLAAAIAGTMARSTGVVIRRDAPLLDAASPTASALGALREGEVVPIIEESGDYLRVEDSAGARGWASVEDVRRLDRPPR